MALVRITPREARVDWDRRHQRPSRVRLADRDLRVTALAARRDELAAYRPSIGPRVTYLLETDAGRATLVFDAGRGGWFIDALDEAA